MGSFISRGFQQVLNLLYPPKCVSCQRLGQGNLCENCRATIALIQPPICEKCGFPISKLATTCSQCLSADLGYVDAVRSVAVYDNQLLRATIHKFKYQNNRTVVPVLAALLAECYHTNQLKTEIIVPVPLHPDRYKERGFNQSGLLATQLSAIIGQPLDMKTLIRYKVTKAQMSLKAKERKINVAGAFRCRSDALCGKIVLLIDDVCTTGATLNACAEALKNSGTLAVFGLTLARA